MISKSKRTGKIFTGKFAETAVRIGLGENLEGNEQEETPATPSKKRVKKAKK